MASKNRPTAYVPIQILEFREDRPVQEHRITAKAFVQGNDDLWTVTVVVSNQAAKRGRLHEWLVRKNTSCAFRFQVGGRKPHTQRRSHSPPVLLVDYHFQARCRNLLLNLFSGKSQYQDN